MMVLMWTRFSMKSSSLWRLQTWTPPLSVTKTGRFRLWWCLLRFRRECLKVLHPRRPRASVSARWTHRQQSYLLLPGRHVFNRILEIAFLKSSQRCPSSPSTSIHTMPPISIMKSPASAATDIWSPPPTAAEQAPSPVTSHHFFFNSNIVPWDGKLVQRQFNVRPFLWDGWRPVRWWLSRASSWAWRWRNPCCQASRPAVSDRTSSACATLVPCNCIIAHVPFPPGCGTQWQPPPWRRRRGRPPCAPGRSLRRSPMCTRSASCSP